MANTGSRDTLHKITPTGGLGKSTLIGNLHSSIPMPRGATPPPSAPKSGQVQSGQASSTQGTNKNG
jgi:hypothetical protein